MAINVQKQPIRSLPFHAVQTTSRRSALLLSALLLLPPPTLATPTPTPTLDLTLDNAEQLEDTLDRICSGSLASSSPITLSLGPGTYRTRITWGGASTRPPPPPGTTLIIQGSRDTRLEWTTASPYESTVDISSRDDEDYNDNDGRRPPPRITTLQLVNLSLTHASPSVANNFALHASGPSTRLVLQNCHVTSKTGSGLVVDNGAQCLVTNNTNIHASKRNGIMALGGSTVIIQAPSLIEMNQGDGIVILEGSLVTLGSEEGGGGGGGGGGGVGGKVIVRGNRGVAVRIDGAGMRAPNYHDEVPSLLNNNPNRIQLEGTIQDTT